MRVAPAPPPRTAGGAGGGGLASRGGSEACATPADAVRALCARLEAADWKDRVDGCADVAAALRRDRGLAAAFAVPLADALAARMADANAKVAVAALSTADMFLPALRGEAFDRVAPLVLPAVATALASTSRPVGEAARGTLDRLVHAADPSALVQPLVTLVRHGAPKLRGLLLEQLAVSLPEVHARRPTLLPRIVLPLAFELLDDAKPDIRGGVAAVIAHAVAALGPDGVLDAAAAILSAAGGRAAGLSDAGMDKLRRMVGRKG